MDSDEIGKIYLLISNQQKELLKNIENVGAKLLEVEGKILCIESKIIESETELHKINKLKNVFKNELSELVEMVQNSRDCIKSCKSWWCC
jgi:hypothetical protein